MGRIPQGYAILFLIHPFKGNAIAKLLLFRVVFILFFGPSTKHSISGTELFPSLEIHCSWKTQSHGKPITASNKLRQYSNKDENDLYDEDLYYGDKDILFFVLLLFFIFQARTKDVESKKLLSSIDWSLAGHT